MLFDSYLMYFNIACIGLFFGSFLNVLADRLPKDQTILGRSKCESCNHVLAPLDLIPIISFTLLNAKCRYCKASLSFWYPLSEILTSLLFLLTYYLSINVFYPTLYAHVAVIYLLIIVLISSLIVMFLADLRYQIIPDEMQIVFFTCAFILSVLTNKQSELVFLLRDTLLAGIVVMLPLLLIFLITKGRGMGFGDVKFAFNMGILLGITNGLSALYIAFILGGIVGGVILLAKKVKMKTAIPFGPFLFIGTYLMYFFDYQLILFVNWLLRFIT